jgi:hypothetical protein
MKKLLFLLLFTFIGYSQQKAIDELDEFTKKRVVQHNAMIGKKWKTSDNISKGFFNNIFLSVKSFDKDILLQLDIQTGAVICLDDLEGKIIILFKNKDTLELKQANRFECNSRVIGKYFINFNDLLKLSNENIDKIRILNSGSYFDFTIKDDKIEVIRKTFLLSKESISSQ